MRSILGILAATSICLIFSEDMQVSHFAKHHVLPAEVHEHYTVCSGVTDGGQRGESYPLASYMQRQGPPLAYKSVVAYFLFSVGCCF